MNRSVEWAAWDEEALALELQEIQDMDFDLSLTGFATHEIDTLLALGCQGESECCAGIAGNARFKSGDLWLLGPHRVLCGDATTPEEIAKMYPHLGANKPLGETFR